MRKIPFMASLYYVPTRLVDVQKAMRELTVRVIRPQDGSVNHEDHYQQETNVSADNEEIKCFDLRKSGYIGVPRQYGLSNFGHLGFVDITTKLKRRDVFPKTIKARDAAQQAFMDELAMLIRGPKPVDIVANARTGTGKTVTALWTIANVIQSPTLVTVPTTYLLDQWRQRIADLMGEEWARKNVGHVQQSKMDCRLITLGVSASLARREYPVWLKSFFSAIIFDEYHTIPTPSMQSILARYPASVRIGFTATNRRDALYKVASLHLGPPRVISRQEVMRPQIYIKEFTKVLPRTYRVFNERHMLSLLSRFLDRNLMLAELLIDRGYNRGRHVVALSDRTDQLVGLKQYLDRFLPEGTVGLLVGKYRLNGQEIKMTKADKEHTANNCQIALATYGLVSLGADQDKWDMGVELTPRVNVRQAIGRILRIRPGKPAPEWYSITDSIMTYNASAATMFADPIAQPYRPLLRDAEARLASFRDQNGTIQILRD